MNKLLIPALLIISLSSCREDVDVPVNIPNEVCFAGKCITLREGYVTTVSNLSNSTLTAFQVDLTDGGSGNHDDLIRMVLYSANTTELTPGKYEWKDSNLREPNSIIQGMMIDVTAEPTNLFGNGTFNYDYHTANQGSITIKKDGVNTTFTISLRADGKSLTGYFNGLLQKK